MESEACAVPAALKLLKLATCIGVYAQPQNPNDDAYNYALKEYPV